MNCFSEGQKVSIWGAYGRSPEAISTVAKISAKKMTLADGSEWTANGSYQWGASRGRFYGGRSVYKYREGDDAIVTRKNHLALIERLNWEILSDAQLATVAGIVQEARDAFRAKKAKDTLGQGGAE